MCDARTELRAGARRRMPADRVRVLLAGLLVAIAVVASPVAVQAQEAIDQGPETFSSSLIAAAQARERAAAGVATLEDSGDSTTLLPTTGDAHVLGILVDFPDMSFDGGETKEVLQAEIGPAIEGMDSPSAQISSEAPYENISAYYNRSSYGQLHMEGYVTSCRAKYERDHYTSDISELFAEVMATLDDAIDFSRFDANEDGVIDGIYLIFAGDRGGWGSTWWPSMHDVPLLYPQIKDTTYDGKTLGAVTLSDCPDGSRDAVSTLIHETGHMLGLPDYYSYDESGTSANDRGIGTVDMMYDTVGDHNAFSKWMLGWIDEEHITRVVVGEDGITVKRGTEEAQTYKGPVDAVIQSLASEDAEEEGEVFAVSANPEIMGEKGLFSSFFLVQYDQAAGNQVASATGLENAFRVYRVQADLTPDGSAFIKTNIHGRDGDKLIETLDPSTLEGHSTSVQCQFTLGDRVTPATNPSTNFKESRVAGFTGIDLMVDETGGESGKVSVAYDGSLKPDPQTFTVADAGSGILSRGPYTLSCSYVPAINDKALGGPVLYVDGEAYDVRASVGSSGIVLDHELAAGVLKPASTCEVVFPAGYFVLGERDGEQVTSNELRVPLKVGPVAELAFVGFYGSADIDEGLIATGASNVARASSGAYVAQVFEDPATKASRLRLTHIGGSDLSGASTVDVAGANLSLPSGTSTWELSLTVLDGDSAVLVAKASSCVRLAWLDLLSGKLTAQTEGIGGAVEYSQVGDVCAVVEYSGASLTVGAYTLAADGIPELRFVALDTTLLLTGKDYVGIGSGGAVGYFSEASLQDMPGSTVEVMPASWLLGLLANGYATEDEACQHMVEVGDLHGDMTLDVPAGSVPVGLAKSGDAPYLLTMGYDVSAGKQAYTLTSFDASGSQIASKRFGDFKDGFTFGVPVLVAGEHGAVSAVFLEKSGLWSRNTAILFKNASLEEAGIVQDRGCGVGAWVDGRWLGTRCIPATREGSISRLRGAATGLIDVAKDPDQPVDPDEPAGPSDPVTPSDPAYPQSRGDAATSDEIAGASGREGIPATGDAALPAMPVALAGFGCFVAAAWRVRRNHG